jgi:hypothetical protein
MFYLEKLEAGLQGWFCGFSFQAISILGFTNAVSRSFLLCKRVTKGYLRKIKVQRASILDEVRIQKAALPP